LDRPPIERFQLAPSEPTLEVIDTSPDRGLVAIAGSTAPPPSRSLAETAFLRGTVIASNRAPTRTEVGPGELVSPAGAPAV
jgi:hypothetical protein